MTILAKKKRALKINTLIKYRNEVLLEADQEDFITADDIVVGTIPVSGYAVYKELRAVSKLKDLCSDFCEAFEERVKPGELLTKMVEIFHSEDDYSWFTLPSQISEEEMSEEERLLKDQIDEANLAQARERMKSLIDVWDQPIASSYDLSNLTVGFLVFVHLKKTKYRPLDGHDVLEDVYKLFVDRTDGLDIVEEFCDMFERIQIKSFSEAVCETIGSVMSIAKGKGRNCDPVKFSEEVTLSYNLPPLHELATSFVPEIISDLVASKDYFRKGDKGPQSIQNRLVSTTLSASIFNFRQSEEKRRKLPKELFC